MTIWVAPAQAQPTSVGDRYSGETSVRPAFQPSPLVNGPTLSWPGKTPQAMAQPASRPAPQPISRSAAGLRDQIQGEQIKGEQMRAPAYAAAPVGPWYERYGVASPQQPTASLAGAPISSAPSSPGSAFQAPPPIPAPSQAPKSIYDPPATEVGVAAVPSSAVAASTADAGNAETVRYYSVHRQYGLTPDPDPIPPQFFTQTADLGDPPGPSAVYKAASSSGGATTAAHTVQSEDATSNLAQP